MGFYDRHSRRLFLRGVGSTLVGIPFLESLVPKDVRAAGVAPPLRYVQFVWQDGRHFKPWFGNMGAGDGVKQIDQNTIVQPLSALHGPMSQIFDAKFDPLRGKMSLLRGLDQLCVQETHPSAGSTTCSISGSDAGPLADCRLSADQAIAHSAVTYPAGVPPGGTRSLVIEPVSDPTKKASSFPISYYNNGGVWSTVMPSAAIRAAFGPGAGMPAAPGAPDPNALALKVVDRARADWLAVKGSPRIGVRDKETLSNFMDLLADMQSSLEGTGGGVKVDLPTPDDQETGYMSRFQRLAKIALAAMAAGNTKVVSISLNETNHPEIGGKDWHDKCSHSSVHGLDGGDMTYVNAYNDNCAFYASFVHYLISQMDAIKDVGGTLLDNSIVLFTSELCALGDHILFDLPVMVAGSLGGRLRQGNFIDYRQRDATGKLVVGTRRTGDDTYETYGRPYNDLFTTVFQAMGIPKEDFTAKGNQQGGFGDYGQKAGDPAGGGRYHRTWYNQFVDGVDRSKNKLPWLWNG